MSSPFRDGSADCESVLDTCLPLRDLPVSARGLLKYGLGLALFAFVVWKYRAAFLSGEERCASTIFVEFGVS